MVLLFNEISKSATQVSHPSGLYPSEPAKWATEAGHPSGPPKLASDVSHPSVPVEWANQVGQSSDNATISEDSHSTFSYVRQTKRYMIHSIDIISDAISSNVIHSEAY